MDQLTVRGLDDDLSAAVRGLAKREAISVSQAVLRLLRRGAGLAEGGGDPSTIGSSSDDLFGTWSRDEAESFDKALEVFEAVDVTVPLHSGTCSALML